MIIRALKQSKKVVKQIESQSRYKFSMYLDQTASNKYYSSKKILNLNQLSSKNMTFSQKFFKQVKLGTLRKYKNAFYFSSLNRYLISDEKNHNLSNIKTQQSQKINKTTGNTKSQKSQKNQPMSSKQSLQLFQKNQKDKIQKLESLIDLKSFQQTLLKTRQILQKQNDQLRKQILQKNIQLIKQYLQKNRQLMRQTVQTLEKTRKKDQKDHQKHSYNLGQFSGTVLTNLFCIFLIWTANQFYEYYQELDNVWINYNNQKDVGKQIEEYDNQELLKKFKEFLQREQLKQFKPHVNVIAGLPGSGKTTTLKKFVRQLRNQQKRLYKVFYFTLSPKDQKQILNFRKNPKQYVQKKMQQLFGLFYSIYIQYESSWNKLFRYKKLQTFTQQNKKQKTIIPIIIVDDISKLQQILISKQNNFNEIFGYMQSLLSKSYIKARIFCISNQTSFYENLKKDRSLNKGYMFKYEFLQPLSKETNRNILRAIARKHIVWNKKLFQDVSPCQVQKIQKYFDRANELPRAVDTIFHSAFDQIIKQSVSSKNLVQELLKKLEISKQQQFQRDYTNLNDFFNSPSKCKIKQQTSIQMLKYITELPTDKINQKSCCKLLQHLYEKGICQDHAYLRKAQEKLSQFNLLTYCHAKSESLKSVILKVKENLQKNSNKQFRHQNQSNLGQSQKIVS